jgi:hypothetical protein
MAGGLVQDQSATHALFDEHEAAAAFDDSRDRQFRVKAGMARLQHARHPVLYAQLAEFPGGFRSGPDLFKQSEIATGDGGLVSISNAFPPGVIDAVEQGHVISEQKRLAMFPVVFVNIAEFDVGIEPAPEADQAIAKANGALWLGDQNPNPCEALGQNETLDDLQESLVVIDASLEVGRENGEPPLGDRRNLDGGSKRVFLGCKNPTATLGSLRLPVVWGVGAGHTELYEAGRPAMCQLDHV